MNNKDISKEINQRTLQSYDNGKWTGPHSPIVLVGKGFSYTGRDKVFECSECKVSVDLASVNVVTLTSHDQNCKIGNYLRENVSLAEQNDSSELSALIDASEGTVCQNIEDNDGQEQRIGAQRETVNHVARDVCKQKECQRNTNGTKQPARTRSYVGSTDARHALLPETVKHDLKIYSKFDMINRAPSRYCFCSACKGYAHLSSSTLGEQDKFGHRVLYNKTLVLNMKRKESLMPIHPEFANKSTRRRSFEQNGTTGADMTLQVEAGFFFKGQGDICCFCCDLGLREELLSYDPWREHARWFPLCPFVLENKTEKFVHDVIIETNMLKEYLRDKESSPEMSTEAIATALKNYSPELIQRTILGFFFDHGGFPRTAEFFQALEACKTVWKIW